VHTSKLCIWHGRYTKAAETSARLADGDLPSCLCTLHIFHVVQAELHHLVPSAPDGAQAQAAPQAWRLHQLYSLCMQYYTLNCQASLCESCAAA